MYRTIDAAFWTDPKVRELQPDAKLLFLYLITNPHTHVSGIYILNFKYVALDIGYPIGRVSELRDTLSGLGCCHYDDSKQVIWVVHMMSYQGCGEKTLRSAAHHISEDLHNSYLCKAFMDFYPMVKPFMKPYTIDTLSKLEMPMPLLIPDTRSLNPEYRIQRTEQKGNRPLSVYSADFETFWQAYPRKIGKGDAFTVWNRNGHPDAAALVAVLERARVSSDWCRDSGRYIPNPSTWLNQKRWDDDYERQSNGQFTKLSQAEARVLDQQLAEARRGDKGRTEQ